VHYQYAPPGVSRVTRLLCTGVKSDRTRHRHEFRAAVVANDEIGCERIVKSRAPINQEPGRESGVNSDSWPLTARHRELGPLKLHLCMNHGSVNA
jgi:hypothetical protein